jgi:predicted negative regulator of RcsB-dependent stress response
MTRHPTSRRVHRPDAEPDDKFVAGVLETTAWAKQHQRLLIIAGVTTAVILIGLLLFLTNRSAQREQAATELSQVRAVAMSGNPALAVRDLEQFMSQYGGTPSGSEARLLLARAYLELGQVQQAIETARPAARNVNTDMGVNAAMLLAAAYEAAQEPHRAEEIFLRVGDGGRFLFQRQEALDNAARIRLQRGEAAGAVELYEQILAMTPEESQDRAVFELRLGEARALAASPAGARVDPPPAVSPATSPAEPGAPGAEQPPGTAPQPEPGTPEPPPAGGAAPTGG